MRRCLLLLLPLLVVLLASCSGGDDKPKAATATLGTDCARFKVDVNYPDQTIVKPGETIKKIWKLQNCGTTTWDGYQVARTFGDSGSKNSVVPKTDPGKEVEVTVEITVPDKKSFLFIYELVRPDGLRFGDVFWVNLLTQVQ